MKKQDLKKNKMPDSPGVYFFLKGKEILYIGKATSLQDRVKSYFSKDLPETRGPIISEMLLKADKVKYQKTDSVLEALILEANLIKKYQPKYNTKEKSDKSFNYVVITKEKFPKVLIKRGKELHSYALRHLHSVWEGQEPSGRSEDSSEHSREAYKTFGPFTSGVQLREALKIIRPIFPFLDDKSKNDYSFYRQLRLVPELEDKKAYLKNIRNLKLFFEGKKKKILQNLEKEMKNYAKLKEFEKAGEIRNKIFTLKHINDIALLKSEIFDRGISLRHSHSVWEGQEPSGRSEDSFEKNPGLKSKANTALPVATKIRIEAYDVAHLSGKNMVGVMVVIENGEVKKNEYRKFKIKTQSKSNDIGALREVLERRFSHSEWRYPDILVVDGGIAQMNAAKKILAKNPFKIRIISVVKDEKHKPREIIGAETILKKYKKEILLANSEAHRFAIAYHKKLRSRNFIK